MDDGTNGAPSFGAPFNQLAPAPCVRALNALGRRSESVQTLRRVLDYEPDR
jgi:hypothetical protein